MGIEAVERIESGIAKRSAYIKTLQQASSLRKMVFVLASDMSDVLTCLEHHLEKMRNLKDLPDDVQKTAANVALAIWAPIAFRLGISAVKDELEDLSLKCTNPDVYEQIKHIVALKKEDRSHYLEKAQKEIYKIAEKNELHITVKSRAKHFWSIYQKMKKRNKSPEELFDLMALRILCDSSDECYRLVGLVHNLWKPVDRRFKDYIAVPKPNGYRSLHTTVMCGSLPLEIQIRTHEMHEVAEHGLASHWLYKQKGKTLPSDAGVTNLLSQFENTSDSEVFMAEIKKELLGDSTLVFTPQGDVIQLPKGATAVDFAYYIHSRIGEKTVGAKADGRIIPLSTPLETAQTIEILTSPQAHPTQNQLELAKTPRARSKIRHWLTLNDESHAEKHFTGTLSDEQIQEQRAAAQKLTEERKLERQKESEAAQLFNIRIDGSSRYIFSLAKCCNPAYGDKIVGYVSRGRGIIIHRGDCSNLPHIAEIDKRLIEVSWGKKT